MKTLQNLSSYFMAFLAYCIPNIITDSLNQRIRRFAAELSRNNLQDTAADIIYNQQQMAIMDEVEVAVQAIGSTCSLFAVLFIYFKDVEKINKGIYLFLKLFRITTLCTKAREFLRVSWQRVKNYFNPTEIQ
jgi:hypothetical protein